MFIRTERSVKEFMRFYPIVSTLIIINFSLWFIIHFMQLKIGISIWNFGAGHNFSIYEFGEYWRFITPIFLHADFMHTLFNSFALVLFGPGLEQMLGRFKFIIGYLLAGIAGNIGTYVVDPMGMFVHIGASGSLYGLFGMYIFIVLFRKSLISPSDSQIVGTIFVIGLIMTFIRPGINIYAHIFGFIGGFALGPILLNNVVPFSIYRNPRKQAKDDGAPKFDPNRWNKPRFWIKIRENWLWIILGILIVAGLIGRAL